MNDGKMHDTDTKPCSVGPRGCSTALTTEPIATPGWQLITTEYIAWAIHVGCNTSTLTKKMLGAESFLQIILEISLLHYSREVGGGEDVNKGREEVSNFFLILFTAYKKRENKNSHAVTLSSSLIQREHQNFWHPCCTKGLSDITWLLKEKIISLGGQSMSRSFLLEKLFPFLLMSTVEGGC